MVCRAFPRLRPSSSARPSSPAGSLGRGGGIFGRTAEGTYTEFYGDPRSWMSNHAPIGAAVVGWGKTHNS
jgi:hypothetical protein